MQLRFHSYCYAPYVAPYIALNLNAIIIKKLIDSYLYELKLQYIVLVDKPFRYQKENEMNQNTIYSSDANTLVVNKMIRNTYMLLSMTLAFSAVCAAIATMIGIGRWTSLGLSIGGLVLLFVTLRKAEGASGVFWIFAFTGMQGASLGYILNHYLQFANGPTLIMQALGLTSLIFVSLSGYALTTKKDFSFMRGFLIAGLVVMIGVMLINIFIGSSMLFMAMNAGIALLMTGFILYDTSRIVNGGETNYIRATVSLYLDFLNLFISILNLLGLANDD